MSFTDDDLKRLKEIWVNGPHTPLSRDLTALLARLEAAEACIPHVYANRERFNALEKWLRSKGTDTNDNEYSGKDEK